MTYDFRGKLMEAHKEGKLIEKVKKYDENILNLLQAMAPVVKAHKDVETYMSSMTGILDEDKKIFFNNLFVKKLTNTDIANMINILDALEVFYKNTVGKDSVTSGDSNKITII